MPRQGKVKINVDLYSASSWTLHTSKVLRYGTRSQGISQFYLHTPLHPLMKWTMPAFAFPAESGTTTVAVPNTAQNSSNNFPSYPQDIICHSWTKEGKRLKMLHVTVNTSASKIHARKLWREKASSK